MGDMQAGSIVEFVHDGKRGQVQAVRGWAADPESMVAVVNDEGKVLTVRRSEVRPIGWAAVLQHIRLFLPELQEDEVVIFQNVLEMRSVPEIAHAHVFIRARSDATRAALHCHHQKWLLNSPWAEHERLGGRGVEVGFTE